MEDAEDTMNQVVEIARDHLGFVQSFTDHFENGDKEAAARTLAAAIPSDIKTLEYAIAESKEIDPDLGAESLPDLEGLPVEEVLKHPTALVSVIDTVDPSMFRDLAELMREYSGSCLSFYTLH